MASAAAASTAAGGGSGVGDADTSDCWVENVTAQWESRRIAAQISSRTVRSACGVKEHHVKLLSDDDDCFLYRTIINAEEYGRLAISNSFIASFDNLPQYLRQLLRAAKQENEYGQSYYVNILSPETLGISSHVELLITTRQPNYAVHNNVLILPFASASDAEFKEYLMMRFEQLKKDKEQLRRSASLLESQLRRERVRSRDLEDKNHWLRKELKFTQNLLKSAESIQKHYEIILSLRHRGETGSTVVTIGDGVATSSNVLSCGADLVKPGSSPATSSDTLPAGDFASANAAACSSSSSSTWLPSAVVRKTSLAYSQEASDEDARTSKCTKRKVSFCNATDTDSESDDEQRCGSSRQHNAALSAAVVERKRPPPRKYAATVLQLDHQLMQIRNQRSEEKMETTSTIVKAESGNDDGESDDRRALAGERDTSRASPLLPSPVVARVMSPPSVMPAVSQETGERKQIERKVSKPPPPPLAVSFTRAGSVVKKFNAPTSADSVTAECPREAAK